jgi:hypothetical protein
VAVDNVARGLALANTARLVRIGELIPDGVTTTFSFTSIPATYKGLELHIMLAGHGASLIVRFNNDSSGVAGTSGKYQLQSLVVANTTATPSQSLLQTGLNISPSLGGNTSLIGTCLNYATNLVKMMRFNSVWGGVGTGSDVLADYGGAWNDTTAINRVDVVCGTAPTNAVGFVRLYGYQ